MVYTILKMKLLKVAKVEYCLYSLNSCFPSKTTFGVSGFKLETNEIIRTIQEKLKEGIYKCVKLTVTVTILGYLYTLSKPHHVVKETMILILQMSKLRLRVVEYFLRITQLVHGPSQGSTTSPHLPPSNSLSCLPYAFYLEAWCTCSRIEHT